MKNHTHTTRRQFLATAGLLAAGSLSPAFSKPILKTFKKRQFKLCLNPGIIGVKTTQKELLDMAIAHGYEAIISLPNELMNFTEEELQAFRKKMKQNKISWGSTNLPVEFRRDEARFKEDLQKLPTAVQALKRAGATRMNTWVLNGDNALTYNANMKQHADRLRECAKILGEHNIRLGLEYVSPKTIMTRFKYPFMRTMAEARELISIIGEKNVGLVLDSFHWYCAEDTTEDILSLDKNDIITCDINDARTDLSRDEQIDGTRELPGATGVIDLKPFLSALVEIGYDGPIRAEPFNKTLNEMDNEAALKATHTAMAKAFALVE
ncbi:MAG: sugar phosphate isomerase/epimerase family protein [Saprospiraceae bacterium]|nr:sugar phosphate isomerase/epimerase [Lewinella sp.]